MRERAAVEAYTKDRSTYARLGERWHVAKSTAYERVRRALGKQQMLLERTKQNLGRCDGVCLLDAKHRRIHGKKYAIFVAWDRGLGQPLHALIKEGGEKELWYWKLMTDLKRIGYVPKGFVSDGFMALKEFIADAYPGLPHQRCTAHVFMFAKSKVATGHGLRSKEWSALTIVSNALEECFVCRHPHWRHLQLPRTSNAVENVMGQLEARFKTTRVSKSESSITLLMNRLLLQIPRQSINH